jgi:hypothetical protein
VSRPAAGGSQPGGSDRVELRALADRYARGVDRRDRAAYVGAFHPDGVLEIYRPRRTDVLAKRLEGHDELGRVTDDIGRYERTFHVVGQATYDVDGDRATGEVYCVAHHVVGDTDRVMYIRYEDEYTRRDGRWAIEVRRLRNEWNEVHAVEPAKEEPG